MVAKTIAIIALVLLLRLPFLHQAIQGDDPYYLYGAEHAQIDPLHPNHARYVFQGDLVDMRGHPHPPLDAWVLGALLAMAGDIREVPFHLAYIAFSLIAALAMWSLARRFCGKPFFATLLFIAVPAFVVNGNSLESDLPFLAFWMAAIAFFVKAADEDSSLALLASAAAAVLAALAAYQAIFLVPILGAYLWERGNRRPLWWAATLVAPLTIAAFQLFERVTSGALPAAMFAGYMGSYGLQAIANKARSATALLVHLGWIVSPLLILRATRWRWVAAVACATGAAVYDIHPLFWLSIGFGVLVATSCCRRGFLEAWVLVFFAGALMIFYAGSARYLLPIAAPVAILAARANGAPLLAAGFGLQLLLSLGLAVVNYQHWDAYRQFAATIDQAPRRWINGEWGLRYYLESSGALPLMKDQALQPGEILVSSELSLPLPVSAALAPIIQTEIRPSIPLRIVSLDRRSAYSAASPQGLLPFEISRAPIDRVHADAVIERQATLSYIDPHNQDAATQMIAGLFPDGWMAAQATVLLKRPDPPRPLRASIYISPQAPARHLRMMVDGQLAAEETFPGPGAYDLTIPAVTGGQAVTVTLTVDRTFSVPGDGRKLGVVVTGVGFR